MTKSILVTGKNGQLGQSLQKIAEDYPQLSFTFVGREEIDLSQSQSIGSYFVNKYFDVIINCAAYTAVDKAESEPELANQINHFAVKQLAKIAKIKNITFIHISTDYVFNGQNYKPYIETDPSSPVNTYGLTKLKGEQSIQTVSPRYMIIRTSWVYSEFGNNFVKTMLKLGKERNSLNVIFDQVGTPTYASDLAKAILDITQQTDFDNQISMIQAEFTSSQEKIASGSGVYHYSNEGVCSWYDFSLAIFKLSKIKCLVTPIETKDYPTTAERPYNSLLNKAKIKQKYHLVIPYWRDSIEKMIELGIE